MATKSKTATTKTSTKASAAGKASGAKLPAPSPEEARVRLKATGRNDVCPCGSGKKYKKCHLVGDEAATIEALPPPDADVLVQRGWQMFEQRRPSAAEKTFREALAARPGFADAHFGIGMARVQLGDADGAREELGRAVEAGRELADKLRADKVKDAFVRPEAQSYLRACHALGCLDYDKGRFKEAVEALERVLAIDEGMLGVEARLVSAKAFMKMEKPADAARVLGPAAAGEAGARAHMGLVLAHFAAGKKDEAKKSLDAALAANPSFSRVVTGKLRRHVDNPAAALPGSPEEALLWGQTYGDVWTDEAKKFVEEATAGE